MNLFLKGTDLYRVKNTGGPLKKPNAMLSGQAGSFPGGCSARTQPGRLPQEKAPGCGRSRAEEQLWGVTISERGSRMMPDPYKK